MFWLELLWEADIIKQALLRNLYNENEELLKIMVVSRKKSEKINSITQLFNYSITQL